MENLEHGERCLDGRRAAVVELRPRRLIVSFDGRRIFGQRPLASDVGVEMAVRDVVHDLPHGPAVWTIRRVELRFAKITNGGAHVGRCGSDDVDRVATLCIGQRFRPVKPADRIAEIFHGVGPGVGARVSMEVQVELYRRRQAVRQSGSLVGNADAILRIVVDVASESETSDG